MVTSDDDRTGSSLFALFDKVNLLQPLALVRNLQLFC
jgi:hypothetical protein